MATLVIATKVINKDITVIDENTMMDNNQMTGSNRNTEMKILNLKACYAFIITYRLNFITVKMSDYRELHQVYDDRYSVVEEVDESDFEFNFRKAVSKWVFQNGSYNE